MAMLTAAACGEDPPDPTPTAAQWFDHFHDAERQGIDNLRAFYGPDVRLDHRSLGADVVSGRPAALDYLRARRQATTQVRVPVAPVYLSSSGAVDPVRMTPAIPRLDGVLVHEFDDDGIASELVAPSERWWRETPTWDEHWSSMRRRLLTYVKAWSSGDGSAVAELYARTAS
jgi:hypothetical protein